MISVLTCSVTEHLFVPAPLGMTEVADNVDMASDDCADFTEVSVRLVADVSGDQPLCLFFGGPAFAGGPVRLKTKSHDIIRLGFIITK